MRTFFTKIEKIGIVCILATAFTFAAGGCSDDIGNELSLQHEFIEVDAEGATHTVDVLCSGEWKAGCPSSKDSWISVQNETNTRAGNLVLHIARNDTPYERMGTVHVEAGGAVATLTVKQKAADASLSVSEQEIVMYKDAEKYKVMVLSNTAWDVTSSREWCTTSAQAGVGSQALEIAVAENKTGHERTATVTLTSESGGEILSCNIVITQKSVPASLKVSPTEKKITGEAQDVNVTILTLVDWKATSDSDWLSLGQASGSGDATLKVSASANSTGEERSGVVTVYTTVGEERESHIVKITQSSGKFFLDVPITEYLLNKNQQDVKITYLAEGCQAALTTLPDWITLGSIGEETITLKVSENKSSDNRNTTFSIYSKGQAGEPAKAIIDIHQSATEYILDLFFDNVELNPAGETRNVPISTTSTAITISSSDDWCKASVSGDRKNIVLEAEPNFSGSARDAAITLSITTGAGEKMEKTFIANQKSSEVVLGFDTNEYRFAYTGDTRQVKLNANVAWELDDESYKAHKGWLTLSTTSGTSTTSINIEAKRNVFMRERRVDLVFRSVDLPGNIAILSILQEKNPVSAVSDYKYLGYGYDATGEYASGLYVKNPVLDWAKLEEKNYIAEIIISSNTEERVITGSDVVSFQENITKSAGIKGGIKGFTASVTTTFTDKSINTRENHYGNHKHLTKKQVIKMVEGLPVDNLRDLLTEEADEDINGSMAPENLIKKYGTHILAGFSLGGSLDYYMTSIITGSVQSSEMDIVASAGYSFASQGISVSAGYNKFEELKKANQNFETALLAKGGESQYTSNMGKGSPEMYNNWLTSLSDPAKWVMVDFDGDKLISLHLFAKDPARRTAIEHAITNYFAERNAAVNPISKGNSLYIKPSMVRFCGPYENYLSPSSITLYGYTGDPQTSKIESTFSYEHLFAGTDPKNQYRFAQDGDIHRTLNMNLENNRELFMVLMPAVMSPYGDTDLMRGKMYIIYINYTGTTKQWSYKVIETHESKQTEIIPNTPFELYGGYVISIEQYPDYSRPDGYITLDIRVASNETDARKYE